MPPPDPPLHQKGLSIPMAVAGFLGVVVETLGVTEFLTYGTLLDVLW